MEKVEYERRKRRISNISVRGLAASVVLGFGAGLGYIMSGGNEEFPTKPEKPAIVVEYENAEAIHDSLDSALNRMGASRLGDGIPGRGFVDQGRAQVADYMAKRFDAGEVQLYREAMSQYDEDRELLGSREDRKANWGVAIACGTMCLGFAGFFYLNYRAGKKLDEEHDGGSSDGK